MTRRDLQALAKKAGKPWDMAKGFDNSAPIGCIVPVDRYPLPEAGGIRLSVNSETRQSGDLCDMIWSVAEVISYLSALVTLKPGDLIMTGTPEGVGPIDHGQTVQAEIDGLPPLAFTVT